MTLENWMVALYGGQAVAQERQRRDGMAQVVDFGAPPAVWLHAASTFIANRSRIRGVVVRK